MLRIISALLLITFLICYLKWGQDQGGLIIVLEYKLIFEQAKSAESLIHPLVIIPFLGQIILIWNVIRKRPDRRIALGGMISLGILVLMITLVAFLSRNLFMILSIVPFWIVSIILIRSYKKLKPTPAQNVVS